MKEKESLLYSIIRPIISGLFKFLFNPKYINEGVIPSSGRVILAGNHTSNLDSLLLLSSTKRNIHFLAKKELWHGLKGIIFSNLGLIPVDRKNKNHAAIKTAETYLKDEKLIGIFPEGTTEKGTKKLLPFKIGAVKIAYETNTPIVPFYISGSYSLFSKNLKIEFSSPIYIRDSNLDNESKRLFNIINNLNEGK